MKITKLLLSMIAAAGLMQAGRWTAKNSDGFRGDSGQGGRFDLRVRVNGDTRCEIRGMDVDCRSRSNYDPRDAGSEATAPIPRARMEGLKTEQRDGRSSMSVEQEPNPGNGWALVIRINDNQRGDDGRHHLRITWDRSTGGGWSGGNGGGGWGGSGGWDNGWSNTGWNDWDAGNFWNAPGWATGTFYASNNGPFEQIRIGRNGRAAVWRNGSMRGAYVQSGQLYVDGANTDYEIADSGNGRGILLRARNGRVFNYESRGGGGGGGWGNGGGSGWENVGPGGGWSNNGWSDWEGGNSWEAPGWAVGTFYRVNNGPFEQLRIGGHGRAAVWVNGAIRRAEVRGGQLYVEGMPDAYDLREQGNGRGIQVRGPRGNVFNYRR